MPRVILKNTSEYRRSRGFAAGSAVSRTLGQFSDGVRSDSDVLRGVAPDIRNARLRWSPRTSAGLTKLDTLKSLVGVRTPTNDRRTEPLGRCSRSCLYRSRPFVVCVNKNDYIHYIHCIYSMQRRWHAPRPPGAPWRIALLQDYMYFLSAPSPLSRNPPRTKLEKTAC